MVRVGLFSSLVLVLLMGSVSAGFFSDDIQFSVSQKDYFFLVGQESGLEFNISNDLGRDVSGMITYALSGPGVSNVQSASYTVKDGESSEAVGFGIVSSPTDMVLNLKFTYDDMEVVLDDIGLHFVEKPEEQQNEEDKQKSSEEKSESQQQQSPSQQQQSQQSMQQKVSNSQAAQSGQELKEHMNRDAEKAEAAKQEFMENLQKNEELMKEHQELADQGFEQSGGELNPKDGDSSSGDFKFDYEDSEGNEASLEGRMENGTLTDLKKTNSAEQKKLESLVRADERFIDLDEKLSSTGFSEKGVSYSNFENTSVVSFNYTDEFGNEESVVAEVENDVVKKVYLDKERNYFWMWGLLAVPIFLVSAYFLKRKRKMVGLDDPMPKKVKPFNYRGEARKLLKKAGVEFEKNNFKDAYGLANQGIRLFLSYKNGLNKELTNYEILKGIDGLPKETSEIFDLCCLVEFAKYKPNRKDFGEIVSFGERIVG